MKLCNIIEVYLALHVSCIYAHYEEPNQTKTYKTNTNQTKPDQIKPDQTKTRTHQTRTHQTRTDQTRRGVAWPDLSKSNQT